MMKKLFLALLLSSLATSTLAQTAGAPAASPPTTPSPTTQSATLTQTEVEKAKAEIQAEKLSAEHELDQKRQAFLDQLQQAQNSAASAMQASTDAQQAKTDAETAKKEAATESDTARTNADLTTNLAETAKQNALKATAQAGIALHGSTNVKDNVRIQAVLLPHDSAKKVFGKEIANHYAIIQVIVDNQSEDSSFLLQSVFMDYSNWALSGMVAPTSDPDGTADCRVVRPPDSSQVGNCPGQVASVEYRVVRGQLQEAAVWSGRNTVVRLAVFAGSVSTGLAGLKSKAALGYASSYSGDFIPALQILWPDPTIAQVNRVSDLGFQTNKVFPKGSADILYAFFPIERFLSPGLKHLFLNEPAVFFSPAQLFFDTRFAPHNYNLFAKAHLSPQDIEDTKNVITHLLQASDQHQDKLEACPAKDSSAENKTCASVPDASTILALLLAKCKPGDETSRPCRYQQIFASLSLNNVRVVAGGVMSVNTQTVPANILSIDFPGQTDPPVFWTETDKPHLGSVTGRFLTGGRVTVSKLILGDGSNADPKDYFDPLPFADGQGESSDSFLPFTMKIKKNKAVPPGATIYFAVTKSTTGPDKKPTSTQSMDYELKTPLAKPAPPSKPAPSDPPTPPKADPAPVPPALTPTPASPASTPQTAKRPNSKK